MAIYDFFLSRNNAASTPQNYVGHSGRLFYNSDTGEIRLSNGSTAGGIAIPITLATTTVAGGVKLGPGVTLNNQGQIVIDPTGLDFAFGDFVATTETVSPFGATLGAANVNQDINIVTNGTGDINIIGEFNIYKTDTGVPGALAAPPIFKVLNDGQVAMFVTQGDANAGAVSITGSGGGAVVAPGLAGTMLHITGQEDDVCRTYIDGNGSYVSMVARRWNGNTTTGRTQVLANEDVLRINATAQTSSGLGSVALAQISMSALENQTSTAQGSKITFTVTPIGSSASSRVNVATVTVADGITATKFTGPLTGTADIASSVALTATNSTNATHYLTFVDSATGNEAVRTDTGLTYNPSTNRMAVGEIVSKLFRNSRNAGTIASAGTLTIDFSTDDLVYCVWGDGMTIAYQNFVAGSVVRLIATKATGTGVDLINLDGVTASHVSNGSTTTPNASADTTVFIEFTCIGNSIGDVYVKL